MSQPDLRAALNHHDTIAAALATRPHEELVRIAADLIKTYVVDGVSAQKVDVGRVHVPQSLRGLSFGALMETLKFHLDLRELESFSITDGQVFVKLGNQEFALDGPAPSRMNQPANTSVPAPASRSTPGGARPPGNSLFGGDTSGARPAARPGAPVESAPTVREAPMRPEPTPRPDAPKQSDDRFRMLELD